MKYTISLYANKSFRFFVLSQGISNFGDAFQFIAATSLLVKITGSGLYAAFGLVCSPIISILLSILAGYLSDIKHEKSLLVIIDILRGIVAVLFISRRNVTEIYILMIILSILDMFYNPPKKKMLAAIMESNHLMMGNSTINGVSGFMFIIGPFLAGLVISKYSVNLAFFINGVSFFISAFMIMIMKYKSSKSITVHGNRLKIKITGKSTLDGLRYCMGTNSVRNVIFLGTLFCFGSTSVNIAFYPYAFDIIKISNMDWSNMISIFYGANLIAMFITLSINSRIRNWFKTIMPFLFMVISLMWVSYDITNKINCIMLLQLVEGTAVSFLNTALTTQLQTVCIRDVLGRVVGMNDFVNSIGKIFGIIFTYSVLKFANPGFIFLSCAVILFVYAIYALTIARLY